MTSTSMQKMKQDVVELLRLSPLWTEDRYGNFKDSSGKLRIKLNALALRVERLIEFQPDYGGKVRDWKRMMSSYYKDITTAESAGVGGIAIKVGHGTVTIVRGEGGAS